MTILRNQAHAHGRVVGSIASGTESVPATDAESASDRAPVASARILGDLAFPLRGRRILVAEDTAEVRELLQFFLEEMGARVRAVEDGLLAVEAALAEEWDLVLMDVQMPRMDGRAAARAIHLGRGALAPPMVALSADSQPDDLRRSLDAGLCDHVAKPFALPRLLDTVLRNLR